MARATVTRSLDNTNGLILELKLPEEWNGAVSIFLAANATGTVVLEYENPSTNGEWVQVKLKDPSIAVNAEVDSIAGSAAAHYVWAEAVGITKCRARRTAAGATSCLVTLTFGRT